MQKPKLQIKSQKLDRSFFSVLGLVGITIFLRLIPHPPNFAPIGALAIFSGSQFNKKTAWLLPLVVMFVSDVFLGFHSVIPFVYGSFVIIALLGSFLKKNQPGRVLGVGFLSSIIFFIVSNFGVWLMTNLYTKNLSGLINCYAMAVPFFRNTLLSDVIFTAVFFYGYQLFFVFLKKLRFSFK